MWTERAEKPGEPFRGGNHPRMEQAEPSVNQVSNEETSVFRSRADDTELLRFSLILFGGIAEEIHCEIES